MMNNRALTLRSTMSSEKVTGIDNSKRERGAINHIIDETKINAQ